MARWVRHEAAALLLALLQVKGQSETSLGFFVVYQYVRKCNEHLAFLLYLKFYNFPDIGTYPYDSTYFHTRYASYMLILPAYRLCTAAGAGAVEVQR